MGRPWVQTIILCNINNENIMKIYDYMTQGTCSQAIHIELLSLIHSDAADDLLCVDLGGRRIIKKKKKKKKINS